MRAGKFAGVELLVNNWFIGLIAFFALCGLVSKVLLVFSAVLWHELAHMLMAMGLGYKVRQIELLPFGAVARVERLADAGATSEIMIAAAGPLASFGLAALCYTEWNEVSNWQDVFKFYGEVNLMLALFNLLPALPLDGGRILRAVLSLRRDYRSATAIVVMISYGITGLLVILAGISYWLHRTVNLTLLVAAAFLLLTARTENTLAGFRTMRILAHKKAQLLARGIMPAQHLTAMENAALHDIVRLFGAEEYNIVHIVDQNFKLCGALTETEVWEGLLKKGINSKINEFL
ncbi:M50 family metallopeptidase [Sporomusa acidovorans]|uniref:Peptidase M50 domain-containing protein n=1 Tax=Sporomusa acidovorans (strain ATCC 49682 / DSM 3132 / Mol) TaxID=1123286 RepID=A0ABZ3J1W3_SPOA4|nr:M50 family metallopeptidase [Sporomusa acidovorans]OZC22516.1 stage IV sporulation protein FB [Sporomusa acidovorans DSM 3132]SDE73129.1 stage IV sporulation protein FB [Sporomusa acidovorans]